MFAEGDQGRAVGQGRADKPKEEFKINGQYVNTPAQGRRRDSVLRRLRREGVARVPRPGGRKSGKPFFMSINFMKVHQPNMPHPDFIHKSLSKSKYADSVVENDTRIGRIMDKVRALGLDKGTRWSSGRRTTAPGRTSTPTPATPRSAAPRAPCARAATACRPSPGCPARSRRDRSNYDIVGGLDLMATFAEPRRREAARQGSRGQADHLRQLRHVTGPVRHRQVRAHDLVLLHRE